jgi:hypothetical protein
VLKYLNQCKVKIKILADIDSWKKIRRIKRKNSIGSKTYAQEQGDMEMLDNRLKKDSYLSTDRPEVQMDKILENITKVESDKFDMM